MTTLYKNLPVEIKNGGLAAVPDMPIVRPATAQ